jgi:hypothetical protein
VHYPGAVVDPDTGELLSDAEVAETQFTAFASTQHPVTARLIVRRVRDRTELDELFPVWRHHPFLTNSDESTVSTAEADLTHRRHAIIETVFADLIDGPLAHLPSGRFAANSAWAICAQITHNLLRAAGTLSSPKHAVARGATLRRQIVTVPARIARPQRQPLRGSRLRRKCRDASERAMQLRIKPHWPGVADIALPVLDHTRAGPSMHAPPPTLHLPTAGDQLSNEKPNCTATGLVETRHWSQAIRLVRSPGSYRVSYSARDRVTEQAVRNKQSGPGQWRAICSTCHSTHDVFAKDRREAVGFTALAAIELEQPSVLAAREWRQCWCYRQQSWHQSSPSF